MSPYSLSWYSYQQDSHGLAQQQRNINQISMRLLFLWRNPAAGIRARVPLQNCYEEPTCKDAEYAHEFEVLLFNVHILHDLVYQKLSSLVVAKYILSDAPFISSAVGLGGRPWCLHARFWHGVQPPISNLRPATLNAEQLAAFVLSFAACSQKAPSSMVQI